MYVGVSIQHVTHVTCILANNLGVASPISRNSNVLYVYNQTTEHQQKTMRCWEAALATPVLWGRTIHLAAYGCI